jgi:hypothetical protein
VRLLAAAVAMLALLHAVAAQERVVLAVEGWDHSEGNGVSYFRCASAICAKGSVVSYKRQPHRPSLSLADFERHHRGLAENNKKSATRIRDVRLEKAEERRVEGVRVFSLRRAVDWADGTTTFSVDALLTGPQTSYTVISDSPRMEWTVNNFEGFLPRLVEIALLAGP